MTIEMHQRSRPTAPSPWKRLLRAYGPILLVALGFLLMVWLIPTIDRTADPQGFGVVLSSTAAQVIR